MRCTRGCGDAVSSIGLTLFCPACQPAGVPTYPIALPADPQPHAPPAPEADPSAPWPPAGEVVLYTLGHGPMAGEQRPAIVIRHIADPRPMERVQAFLAKMGDGKVRLDFFAAFLALSRSESTTRLARPLALFVLTDPSIDGLDPHNAPAAYSAAPLAWHWTPRPAPPARDL